MHTINFNLLQSQRFLIQRIQRLKLVVNLLGREMHDIINHWKIQLCVKNLAGEKRKFHLHLNRGIKGEHDYI